MMVTKTIYFSVLLVCQRIVDLRAKPHALNTSVLQGSALVNLHRTEGRSPYNPSALTLNRISTSADLVRNASSILKRRRQLIVTPKSNKGINNGSVNSFFDEDDDYNQINGIPTSHSSDPEEKTDEEIRTFLMEVQEGEFTKDPKIDPAYSELKSDKCYLLFERLVDDSSEFGFLFNIYYWIGKDSSFKDAAAAASGAVSVDALVHPTVILYREAEGHESLAFKSLFVGNDDEIKFKIEAFEKTDVRLKREKDSKKAKQTSNDVRTKSPNVIYSPDENLNLKINVIRIYKNEEDGKYGEEEIQERDIAINDLNDNDCYLIDSGVEDVGLFVRMGKNTKDKLNLRMEAARRAELYLRNHSEYNFVTPINFVDPREVPLFWTVKEMIKFINNDMYFY